MPLEVFISYSHKDRTLRNELATHLSNLRKQDIISDWYDGDLIAGTEWEPDILEHLRTAKSSSCSSAPTSWPRPFARISRCKRP